MGSWLDGWLVDSRMAVWMNTIDRHVDDMMNQPYNKSSFKNVTKNDKNNNIKK